MVLAIALGFSINSRALLQEARLKIERAQSLSVTLVFSEEGAPFPPIGVKFLSRRGGYSRREAGPFVFISSPRGSWMYETDKRTYRKAPILKTDMAAMLFNEELSSGLPPVGEPVPMSWNGLKVLRVKLNCSKREKGSEMYVYFDPVTHLPVGSSAITYSVPHSKMFKDLKLDTTIPDSAFEFEPPKDWKQMGSRG